MKFGSVCSGIEAASVAWEPLGWRASWVAEVDPFPSAVLAHHWPDVPNHGDMLALPDMVAKGTISAPDVLVGGTPCQAFSFAGRRGSLGDKRGALTLAYVELANEIDRTRRAVGAEPCVIVWENVPGVLNTKDNAFGCFLGALAGEDGPLEPAGPRWTNAGCVFGPERAIAWRILDAQYFGLAQRRRRVFVVASAREGFDPCEVLFEFDGVRRDTPPRREARQDAAPDAGPGFEVAGTLDARTNGGGFPGSDGATSGHVVPSWPAEVASTLNAAFGSKQGLEDQHVNGGCPLFVPAIPILEAGARTGKSTTFTLQAGKQHAVAFAENTRAEVRLEGGDGSRTGALSTGGGKPGPGMPVIACAVTGDITHALSTANNGKGSSEDGTGRGVPTIAYTLALRGREGGATAELGGEVATALRASTGGGDKPHILAFSAKDYGADATDNLSPTLRAGGHSKSHANAGVMPAVATPLAVRRLTPVECEFLMGFPRNHTLVPYRNKPAADGPRYKALGNSMAVPVMRWIGERIDKHLSTN